MGRKVNKIRPHSRNHKRLQARKRKRETKLWEEVPETFTTAGVTAVDDDDDDEDNPMLDITEYEVMEVDEVEERPHVLLDTNDGPGEENYVSSNTSNTVKSRNVTVGLESFDHASYQDSTNYFVNRSFRQSKDFDVSDLDSYNLNGGQHACSDTVENASNIIRTDSRESFSQTVELNGFEFSEDQVASKSLEIPNIWRLNENDALGLSSSNLSSFQEASVSAEKETVPHKISQETCDTEYLSCDEISNGEVSFTAMHHSVSQETYDTEYLSCDELDDYEISFEPMNNDDQNHSQLDQSFHSVGSIGLNGHLPFVSEKQSKEPDNVSQESHSPLNADNSDMNVNSSNQSFPASSNPSASAISGNRIFNPMFYQQQLKKFGTAEYHTPNCSRRLENIEIDSSYNTGLNTLIYFKCLECQLIGKVYTNPPKPENNDFTINETSVLAVLGTGCTFTAFQSILAIFDIPYISHNTFSKYREKFDYHIDDTLRDEMKRNSLKEKEIAVKKGDVTPDGTPFIRVMIDGCYGKRSYPGGKYDSLGAAVGVIGQATQKLIDLEIFNKYCVICLVAEKNKVQPKKHTCYMNYDRNLSSGSMEAAGAATIFGRSLELYGIIFIEVIGDDDSSSYNSILKADPYKKYNKKVIKRKCSNHIWRRFGTHILEASNAKAIKSYGVGVVREKIKASGMKIRKVITTEIDRLTKDMDLLKISQSKEELKEFKEKTEELQKIIKLAPYHVFGDHENCPSHWPCDRSKPNFIPKLIEYGLLEAVKSKAMEKLSLNASHLLYKFTTNAIEQCFSIVSKYITGKRNNYYSRCGYKDRVSVAAIDQITGTPLTAIYSHSKNSVPQNVSKIEKEHVLQRLRNKKYRENNKNKNKRWRHQGANKDYGPNAAQPDLVETDPELYEKQKEAHNQKLRERQQNRIILETKTRAEVKYGESHAFETDMIPSFLFGKICRMAETTSCIPVVNNICNPLVYENDQLQLLENQRAIALRDFQSQIGSNISPCGIFVSDDEESFYLCARPDGTVEDDSIVIVCNISADEQTTVDEALKSNRNLANLFSAKYPDKVNTNHLMYYNIQGQLHVCGKKYCHFAVYTPKGLKSAELIVKDDNFWSTQMKEKLNRFYFQALIDEIIDSRVERSMQIREAPFTIEARSEKAKREAEKSADTGNKLPKKQKISGPASQKQPPTKLIPPKQPKVSKTCQNSSIDDNYQQFVDGYRLLVLERTDEEFHENILTADRYLDDVSISSFLLLLEERGFSIEFPFAIQNPFKASTSSNDLLIVGGHFTNQHWFCVHFDGQNVFIYDSLAHRDDFLKLSAVEQNYIKVRYPKQVDENRVIFKKVTSQLDGSSCGVYAAAYATTIALGGDPSNVAYSQNGTQMREHFYHQIIIPRQLVHFP